MFFMADKVWQVFENHVLLRIKVQSGSKREGVKGICDCADGKRILLAVNAPPEDGKANKSVIDVLATSVGIAKRSFTLQSGEKNRLKTLVVETDITQLQPWLDALPDA